ncbi:hypothetical protein EST38_g11808 [Candolleomyces aberdarensis]|uniref:Uncharacterized protein n=1 Tax=Candolleomyces aberdarensis TaxID=2316362 RepID=A0A4Q2D4P0_9AGAR|nr:hypothetical protein EST38_g11808 [Candolleomyces aberdarensis]
MGGETLDSLTILSLRPEDGGTDPPFTVFDLFDRIYSLFQSIGYITLMDIDLKPTSRFPHWDPDEEYPDWRTERVHFKACTVGVIDSYSLYSPEAGQELMFEDCNLHGLEFCLPKTPSLTLKNLNAESLGIIIQKSDAIKIAFEDCPELTDKIILALANAHPDSWFLEQRHLRSLRMHACPRVSAKALKKIVSVRQKRRIVADPMPALARTYLPDENDYLDGPPLKSLILSGLNGKRVSNGMRSWFEDNLEEFLER